MKTWQIIVIFTMILLSWLGVSLWSYCDNPNTFDKLNCLYVLFTGLAFCGLLVSISIQTQQLNSNARMNAISSLLSNREHITRLLNNENRAKEFSLTKDEVSDNSAKYYKELLDLLNNNL